MEKSILPYSVLFCLVLFISLPGTGNAQEFNSIQIRLYVDPFFTDDNYGLAAEQSAQIFEGDGSEKSENVSRGNATDVIGAQTHEHAPERTITDRGMNANEYPISTVDEALIPAMPLRQRSCRPY